MYSKLPELKKDKVMEFPHFPSRFHAAVFKLWETCSADDIANALDIDKKHILKAAEEMGLPAQKHTELWKDKGYITTIRNAWHILPYENLLKLLGWTEDELATILKEDDFLFVKLGDFKPYCEPIVLPDLDDGQKEQLKTIKEIMTTFFGDMFEGAVPFAFEGIRNQGDTETPDSDGLRLIYSYFGLYAKALDCDAELSYSKELLSAYKKQGINAVWLPAALYQLVPFPFDESFSKGYETRLNNLKKLIATAKEYDIKVYLYLNEPRCMPNYFFDNHPELKGTVQNNYSSLCTSNPKVMEYLRYGVRYLCEQVSDIGGFFCITCSENLTHCRSRHDISSLCPRCADLKVSKLVSDVVTAINGEAKSVNPDIDVIVWTWAWEEYMDDDEVIECLNSLPKDVILLSNSEVNKEFVIGGVEGRVRDYSISIPGPSDFAKRTWKVAREKGLEIGAKVQINSSWECSTLPYLPVFDLVREHMTNLKNEGVKHLMLSWTLGGYPSISMKIAASCLADSDEESYKQLLKDEFGEWSEAVYNSSKAFSEAFREYPFHIYCVYNGPHNAGPSNPLYLTPSGFQATMTCYAYDDIDSWRCIYPRNLYSEQFHKVSDKWEKGLEFIKTMPDCEYKQMAYGAYYIFRSCYLQTKFVLCREEGDTSSLLTVAKEEKQIALSMYKLMCLNSGIGYEAANHYYYNKGMLAEKYLNCQYIEKALS